MNSLSPDARRRRHAHMTFPRDYYTPRFDTLADALKRQAAQRLRLYHSFTRSSRAAHLLILRRRKIMHIIEYTPSMIASRSAHEWAGLAAPRLPLASFLSYLLTLPPLLKDDYRRLISIATLIFAMTRFVVMLSGDNHRQLAYERDMPLCDFTDAKF